ncbi:hypothetical protein HYN59_00580 [Flavobacterium album]|uniref:Signal peptidase n=1 Tax=Flavobacterium album TaxID=2175091 RepID=A0A2S1QTE2_9FLAO|nr:hypothetical protein [Flavobacterium album]AWH83700.1 hypothetical protein HYN59_00580 [Flavobacterium album]
MNLKIKSFFAWVLISFSGLAYAQFDDEGPDPPPPGDEPPAPIDGYQVYLVILGLLLAYYFLKRGGLFQGTLAKPDTIS